MIAQKNCANGLVLLLLVVAGCTAAPETTPTAGIPPRRDPILADGFINQPRMLIDRVVVSLPPGVKLGQYRIGIACSGPYGSIFKSDLRGATSRRQLRRAGQQALENAGYRTVRDSDDMFQYARQRREVDWLIGARIDVVDADLCRQTDWLFSRSKGMSGQMTMKVSWQVFDATTEKTILRVETNGFAQLPDPANDGLAAMMEISFADAFDRLASDHLEKLLQSQPQTSRGPAIIPDEELDFEDDFDEQEREITPDEIMPMVSNDDDRPADLLPIPAPIAVVREDGRVMPVSVPTVEADKVWPEPWKGNLTDHADQLIDTILRQDADGSPVLAVGGNPAAPVLVSVAQSSQKPVSVRREDGQKIMIHAGPSFSGLHLYQARAAVKASMPLSNQKPKVGMAVALISDVEGKKRLEPILTSGLIARVASDSLVSQLWLDVPRHVRDRPFFVWDASGNLLAVTRPDLAGGGRDGFVPAVMIDKKRLHQAVAALHAESVIDPSVSLAE